MHKKTWQEKLNDSHDLPKVEIVEKEMLGVRKGQKLLIAPPIMYDEIMKRIPEGEIISVVQIREQLARKFGADSTCPLTAGLFVVIVAHAAEEVAGQGKKDTTPWWRTVKAKGELNPKFPGGITEQAKRLQAEGHEIMFKGSKAFVMLRYS